MENELYHQVTTFRDGTIVRIEYVTTWDEALEAAGPEALSVFRHQLGGSLHMNEGSVARF